jgi:hypothetical protein
MTPPLQEKQVHVLGALLGDMPEAALLSRAVTGSLRVAHETSRLDVLARLRGGDFDAVVFPVLDGRGLPTAPLIQQCAAEHARVVLLAVCCAPPARASAVLAAARAGARVIVSPSVPELTALLCDISPATVQRLVVTRASLHGVEPRFLRDVLATATQAAAESGRVGAFAASLNVSTRTLSRQLRRAGLPSPRELLAVARLLLACAEMESLLIRDAETIARLSGFATTRRLVRTARQYGVPVGGDRRHPSLPRFSDALVAVVTTLGGRLSP